MASVAVVGLLLGGGIEAVRLTRRASTFNTRAAAFARNETYYANRARQLETKAREADTVEKALSQDLDGLTGINRIECLAGITICRAKSIDSKQEAARCREKADWYAMMKRKYRAAASRPWLSVAPDPSEPE